MMLSFILVVILYAAHTLPTEGRCTNGEIFPDLSDETCKKYLVCNKGQLEKQTCYRDFVYSKTINTCVPPFSSYNDCHGKPPDTQTTPIQTTLETTRMMTETTPEITESTTKTTPEITKTTIRRTQAIKHPTRKPKRPHHVKEITKKTTTKKTPVVKYTTRTTKRPYYVKEITKKTTTKKTPVVQYTTRTTKRPYYVKEITKKTTTKKTPAVKYTTKTTETPYYPEAGEYTTRTTKKPYYLNEYEYTTRTTKMPYYPKEVKYPTRTTKRLYYPKALKYATRTTKATSYQRCKDGETSPNTYDCKSYYVCSYDRLILISCPMNYVYSQSAGKCQLSHSPYDSCYKTTKNMETTPEPVAISNPTSVTDGCISGETFPVWNNCYSYYQCSNGKLEKRTCVLHFVYSKKMKRCVPQYSKHADCKAHSQRHF